MKRVGWLVVLALGCEGSSASSSAVGSDGDDATDGSEAADDPGSSDASDGSDTGDGTDASDGTDAGDGSDASANCDPFTDASDVSDFPIMDLSVDTKDPQHFYRQPWPADWRLDEDGRQDLRGFPHALDSLTGPDLVAMAGTNHGFPVISAGYFQFNRPLVPRGPEDVIPAAPTAPLLLVDVDRDSPSRGRLVPVVAQTLEKDAWTPPNLLAIAPRPGFVLEPGTTYAYVVMRTANRDGPPLASSPAIRALAEGKETCARPGLAAMYAPLFETLETLGIDDSTVAGATVFTTGDVVQETHDIAEALRKEHPTAITDVQVDLEDGQEDGAQHERFCELEAKVELPQFQVGTPPYATGGLFDESDGLPKKQRDETAQVSIALPKGGVMPEAGFPLVLYFHGSGNLSFEVIDRGPVETKDGPNRKGEGPAFILAPHGFASAGFSLPLNPERLPGAGDTAYLNIDNPKALRDTFRQGAIEARLVLDALGSLEIDPAAVASCSGLSLPEGATHYKLDVEPVFLMGSSTGGMYANIVGAIEPRAAGLAPSGAGGFWTYFILDNPYQPVRDTIGSAFWSTDVPMTLLHPAVHLSQDVLAAADPMNYLPRLGHAPLAGHPARSVYEPVGKGDKYFPTTLFDAIALGYGNHQAGESFWDSMQDALGLAGLGGILDYPVQGNHVSLNGQEYTGAVVQYSIPEGNADPHSIISQLDSVKYQYGCFLKTLRDTGKAVLPAPAAFGTPCPTE